MRASLEASDETGPTHYFYGSTPQTLAKLLAGVAEWAPAARIVGAYAPPMMPWSDESGVQDAVQIWQARPDLVWVGLGTPKQDYAVRVLADAVGVPCVAVGAAFDFLSGEVREAPRWLHGTGFEWILRLASEPRRLWRRYLLGNSRFVVLLFRELRSLRR
jgi:N-acetylglucosaminyldiphosphoundecaprenol N-acetyl-beta-D-mannosaminyltransferase